MTTLKEFEDALREQGMEPALAILEKLKERDRAKRTVAPARRITGKKMTPELAREIVDLHERTKMTQQEIAFKVGVNQGRVNEVIKRGKWLSGDPQSPEARARDEALDRAARGVGKAARPEKAAKAEKRTTVKAAARKRPADADTKLTEASRAVRRVAAKQPEKPPVEKKGAEKSGAEKFKRDQKQLVLGDL
ncbi:RNA polymerase subunit sigma-70 [Skermanella stibiiresistens SB22]|uniref:RNA polymerase subunit sigma-70 n=1 Tax=Skermanella stibiiresistens SB22 TaxID=1385369 RepID=W9H9I1_9PROT|nr:hypothetical protein [Skermanella stibiiresistens]EWY40493.1 RNA polymerase subunit sigma-70 [Skermanella stibiiresistens SB22]